MKLKVAEFIQQLGAGEHSQSGVRGALERMKSESSRWAELKKRGIGTLEEPMRSKTKEVEQYCVGKGMFIVPVGELES